MKQDLDKNIFVRSKTKVFQQKIAIFLIGFRDQILSFFSVVFPLHRAQSVENWTQAKTQIYVTMVEFSRMKQDRFPKTAVETTCRECRTAVLHDITVLSKTGFISQLQSSQNNGSLTHYTKS